MTRRFGEAREERLNELLPKEVIQGILEETGAFGSERASRIVKTVENFKPFRIQVKAQEELDLAMFGGAVEQTVQLMQGDWKKRFSGACTLTLRDVSLMNLDKFRWREEGLCVQFFSDDLPDSFLFFIGQSAFHYVLNSFFGGASSDAAKAGAYFTEVESAVLARICQSSFQSLARSLQATHPTNFKTGRVNIPVEDQYEFLQNDYLVADVLAVVGDAKHHVAFAIPASFLKHVKDQTEKRQNGELRKTDPSWQKTVTETVVASLVEVRVELGAFEIPFEKSVSLRVGDVFSWGAATPRAVLSIHGSPAMGGTLGAIGDRYAIKVEEILFSSKGE